jgi:hypothetical protein
VEKDDIDEIFDLFKDAKTSAKTLMAEEASFLK